MMMCTRLFCFTQFPQFKMNPAKIQEFEMEEEVCKISTTTQRAAKLLQPLTAFAPCSIIPGNAI